MIIRAASLWQPWASAVAEGRKSIETRGAGSPVARVKPGTLLVIHAAQRSDRAFDAEMGGPFPLSAELRDLPRGAYLAVARVEAIKVYRTLDEWRADEPLHLCPPGYFEPGKVGIVLADVRQFPAPIPGSGHQGLWTPPEEVLEAVEKLYHQDTKTPEHQGEDSGPEIRGG
jgi:hypothetical protein